MTTEIVFIICLLFKLLVLNPSARKTFGDAMTLEKEKYVGNIFDSDIGEWIDASCEIVMAIRDRIDWECDGRQKNDSADHFRYYDPRTRDQLTKIAYDEYYQFCINRSED